MMGLRLLLLGCLFSLVLLPGQTLLRGDDDDPEKIECRIIYVPTPQETVEKMLDMAKVKKGDVVYDLGCGDGRIVCTAAKKGAKAVGVDIDPARIKDCMETMKKFGVTEKEVEFRQGNALKVKDLSNATVVTFYMLPEFMEKLEPQLKNLKPGTRLVAHDYPFPNLKADEVIDYRGPSRTHTLYLWVLKGDGDKKKE